MGWNRNRTPRRSRKYSDRSTPLRMPTSAPVVTMRGPRVPGAFTYTDADRDPQWVKVVAQTTKYPDANLHQLLIDLEAAGQRYQTAQRNLRDARTRRTLRQALILDALQAWSNATGDTALKFSREGAVPSGPLIRYLRAALVPILGEDDMVGREVLAQTICRARRLRKSG